MIGQTLTHYRITAKLGTGGMGEVYRATDSKLGRDVAIKVLPPSFSRDAQSLARFEREARALAALNHPHIAAIHGFDADQGRHFLVLEMVEGETLADRLRRGPLPLEEALNVARQMAEAIDAAHDKGIVHRDLKPGNVKMTPDGKVKVLDFGLAKLGSRRGNEPVASASHEAGNDEAAATMLAESTTPGVILGTPAYMSPEQARGQEVDRRTDVWAFGCCLYECLCGRKPFRGQTITDLVAEVLKSDPDWSPLPAETPPAVMTLLRRCLEKEPRRRLSSMGDIAITLEDIAQISRDSSRTRGTLPDRSISVRTGGRGSPGAKTGAPNHGERRTSLWLWSATAGLLLGIFVTAGVFWNRSGWRRVSTASIRSVAVLPFDNLSADPDLDALCNGLSDDISTGLKKTGLLDKVPLWGSVKGYKGSTAPVLKIAEELGVDSLVHATIKRDGPELKVNADLVDGASGKPLWSETFSTKNGDIGRIQNEVVRGLLNHLRLELSADQQTRLGKARSVNAEAYAAYRRGLEHYDLYTKEGFARAAAEFEKARRLDPAFVDPIGSLAALKWLQCVWGTGSATPHEGFREAKTMLAEAVRVDSRHPSVLRNQGWITLMGDWEWKKAIAFFREAAAVEPDNAMNSAALAVYAGIIEGRLEDALREIDRALQIDSERVAFLENKALIYLYHGRYEEALALYRRVHQRHPEHWSSLMEAAESLRQLKRLGEAREAAEQAVQLSERNSEALSILAAIQSESGERGRAQEIVRELEERSRRAYVPAWSMAHAYASIGDTNSACTWLEKGVSEKDGLLFIRRFRSHAAMSLFANQPRYWALVDHLKLPALPIEHAFYEQEQRMRFQKGSASFSEAGAKVAPPSSLEMTRVLVLPLQSRGKEESDVGFAGGLTDALRGKLSQIGGLRILDGSTLTNIQSASLASRCRDLNAGSVLKGTVQQLGGQLRVLLELQNSQTPELIWSDEQTHDFKDIFAVQSQVAQAVAKALSVQLRPTERQELDRKPTQNLEAYQHYLHARDLWNRRTAEGLKKAIALFEAAIQKDTNFARAYAGLADCHVLSTLYSGEPSDRAFPKAMAMAEQALRLDPTIAEPHAALGYAKYAFQWDWEGAEKEFQAAIKLDPNYANGHHWYADMLYCMGTRKEEGLAEAKIAADLDPKPLHHGAYGAHLAQLGRIDEAIAYLEKQIAADPSFHMSYSFLGRIYLDKGMVEEAAAAFEKADALGRSKGRAGPDLAKAYVLLGRMNDARKVLAEIENLQQQGADWRATIALIHHVLGDDASALDILEQVVEERGALVNFFYLQRSWWNLHPNPRFQAILRKVNLLK